jgi:hypothetical protein
MSSEQDKANPPPIGEGFNTPRTEETTNTWLTPLSLIQSLGKFDFDPCCPMKMPWTTAKYMHCWQPGLASGLDADWNGWIDNARIWLNPPYGTETFKWMRKFAEHKRGVALIFARTDTKGFHEHIFAQAKAIYFLKGRVKFHREDGSCPKNGPAAPSCLVMHTEEDISSVMNSGLPGFLMRAGL